MFSRLVLLFVLVPFVELVVLIQLGRWVGLLPTLGLVVATGIVGAAMARAEGLRTLRDFQRTLAEGRIPEGAILDGLSILVGGAFLLTPGLLTDVAGFSLLVPVSRRALQARLKRWLRARLEAGEIRVQTLGGLPGHPFGGPFGAPEGEDDSRASGLDPAKEIRRPTER